MLRPLPSVLVLLAAFTAPAIGAPASLGSEFLVNSTTADYQWEPATAMDSAGNFVVVWRGASQDGDGTGIFGQLFDSLGFSAGSEFQVNTYTTSEQATPAVAMNGEGSFVVVWNSSGQDGSSAGVFGQVFDSLGSAVGGEFRVNSYTADAQNWPSVGMNDRGEFVVAWATRYQDGDGWGVAAQMFNPGGTEFGSEFLVNSSTTGYQVFPDVDVNESGEFVIVWASDHAGGGYEVMAQPFDAAGIAVGAEMKISTGAGMKPSVAMDELGGFMVVYENDDGSTRGVAGQRITASLSQFGSELQVNTYTYDQQVEPEVGMNSQGSYIVVWAGRGDQDGDSFGVFGRAFGSSGIARGAEFQINSFTTSEQQEPSLGMNPRGDFVVAWTSIPDQDGDLYGVFGQRFLGSQPEIVSPQNNDTLDCSDPRTIRPTITWEGDDYDRFKVFMGSDPNFVKGSRVGSGDRWINGTAWTPSRKKWRRACKKALSASPGSPVMYVVVRGKDRDLRKKDPARFRASPVVQVDIQP